MALCAAAAVAGSGQDGSSELTPGLAWEPVPGVITVALAGSYRQAQGLNPGTLRWDTDGLTTRPNVSPCVNFLVTFVPTGPILTHASPTLASLIPLNRFYVIFSPIPLLTFAHTREQL